jgi:hypothetical protein
MKSLKQANWLEVGEVMSNFDHTIDENIEKKLQAIPGTYATYPGWNFFGYVWYDGEKKTFICEAWQFGNSIEIVEGTLQEIMDEISDKYGYY